MFRMNKVNILMTGRTMASIKYDMKKIIEVLSISIITTIIIIRNLWKSGTSIGITTGLRLDGRSSIPSKERFFSYLQCPDQLPYIGYWGLVLRKKNGRYVRLTTQFHLVPRSSMVELYFYSRHMSSWHSV
jgi:hypothetical protein